MAAQFEIANNPASLYGSNYNIQYVTNVCILLNVFQVNAEFLQITTKPLKSKFLSQLDHFSGKLIQIFQSKGGVKGQKIKDVQAFNDSVSRNAYNIHFITLLG